ncbi:ABC transporter ATP-binding protein [Longispora sp. NPDC051575]|uniref:ABC transporter ATP-binding protein n=1 Tax=Longispora sp. NPDC051575 TaxID=3154943 RepID=UPI00342F8ECE
MTVAVGGRRVLGDLAAAARLTWESGRGVVLGYAAVTAVAGLLPVAAAWCTKVLLDRLDGGAAGDRWSLLPVAVGLAAVGLLGGLLPVVGQYLRARLDRVVGVLSMDRLYQAMNRLSGIGRLEDPAFRDQLRMAQQAGRSGPSRLVDDGLGVAQSALTMVGFLGTLLVVNPWMAAVVVASAAPALWAQLRLGRSRADVLWSISPHERREYFYAELLGSLAAAQEIRLLGLGDLFRRRMLVELSAANAAIAGQDRREARTEGLLAGLTAAVAGGGLVWAVLLAAAGRQSIGDVSVFLAAVAGVQLASQGIAHRIGMAHHAMLLFGHYRDIEATVPDLVVATGSGPVPRLRTGIELRDVWFRYGEDQPWVLRGVDLLIPQGRATALVGLNGAGKSTLVKLLCRFYDPTRGAILWDGVDLRELPVAEFREHIGAVFQDYMAYDLSVAENIGLGDVTALDDRPRIVAAADRAGMHPTIDTLPHGYDTWLSRMFVDESDRENPDTGVLLSGGQWQRLALARAFLRDQRDLMILDEPSSGLDAQAEHEVHRRLREHRAHGTSVLISHRLGTVRDADTIVVLAEGRVAEHGTHDELVAADAGYARLFRTQAAGYQDVSP